MKSLNKIYSFIISLLVTFAFGYCALTVPALNEFLSRHGNINMITYAIMLVMFCLLYMVTYAIFMRINLQHDAVACDMAAAATVVLSTSALLFLNSMTRQEGDIYGGVTDRYVWHKLPHLLVVIFFLLLTAGVIIMIRKNSVVIPTYMMFVFYGFLSVLLVYTFYTPNVLPRTYGDYYHSNAYYNSVYNVLHGAGYTSNITSIYGHYAILLRIPMEIMGGDYIDFIRIIALMGGLCFLSVFASLHMLVKNNLLRVLGCLSMVFPVLAMRGGFYWQLWPHRIIFMSIFIFLMTLVLHQKLYYRGFCLLGYLLACLAVLWNTESGLFCAISWAAFWIMLEFSGKGSSLRTNILSVLENIVGVVFTFFGAYTLVNIYNTLVGSRANSIKEFLFPLLNNGYMSDTLRIDLTLFPSAYMAVILLLFLALAWGISHMIIFSGKDKDAGSGTFGEGHFPYVPALAFAVAVLALGQITYYINRAAYHNLDIIILPCILLICILAEPGMEVLKKFRPRELHDFSPSQYLEGGFSLVNLVVLLSLSVGLVVQYGYNTDIKQQFHDLDSYMDFAHTIEKEVPRDTYAFGIMIPEIYSTLRWSTQCYTLDFPDLAVHPESGSAVVEDIKVKLPASILVGPHTMELLQTYNLDEYEWFIKKYKLTGTFEYEGGDAVFEYYTLIPEEKDDTKAADGNASSSDKAAADAKNQTSDKTAAEGDSKASDKAAAGGSDSSADKAKTDGSSTPSDGSASAADSGSGDGNKK